MKTILLSITLLGLSLGSVSADESSTLEEVKVIGEKGRASTPLADDAGTFLYAGKKTTAALLDQVPPIQNNNYRQGFSQLPGLLVAEQTAPSHVNFNYRGVGDPHESEYFLILKDGIPTVSDWFGYSTAYYAPALEAVQRVELIRGGSSLLYGPQPGPVLNYVTHPVPSEAGWSARTQQTMGSDGFYSTYNTFGGRSGPWGGAGYFAHRQANGSRENADYAVYNGSLKIQRNEPETGSLLLNLDAFRSESGEAGRLTRTQFEENRDLTRTPNDRIWIERYVPTITLTKNLSEDTLLSINTWGGYQDRFSRRATGTQTNLDRQEFNFFGTDTRLKHLWKWADIDNTLTTGFVVYTSDSPRSRERGVSQKTTSGAARFDLDRSTQYGALFIENLFQVGKLGIVPAFRLDVTAMSAKENFNVEVSRPLIDDSFVETIPLGGLGLTYDLHPLNRFYANVSQGYRPKEYDDLVNPTSNTQRSPSDLEESRTWNYEVGVRGNPTPWFQYDTSLFWIDYDNFIENQNIGSGNVERSNSGRAVYRGWEGAGEMSLTGLWDSLCKTDVQKSWGNTGFFANGSWLSAEFVSGSNDDREPSYAPTTMVKAGPYWRLHDRLNISLSTLFVDDHFWQDSNAAGSVGTEKVNSYKVWDLAGEFKIYKEAVSLFAGVNNLFNENYYSRVRSDGIDPASERNAYVGIRISI